MAQRPQEGYPRRTHGGDGGMSGRGSQTENRKSGLFPRTDRVSAWATDLTVPETEPHGMWPTQPGPWAAFVYKCSFILFERQGNRVEKERKRDREREKEKKKASKQTIVSQGPLNALPYSCLPYSKSVRAFAPVYLFTKHCSLLLY